MAFEKGTTSVLFDSSHHHHHHRRRRRSPRLRRAQSGAARADPVGQGTGQARAQDDAQPQWWWHELHLPATGHGALCWSCVRTNLMTKTAAAARSTVGVGIGGGETRQPKHVEHLFELMQPERWGLPSIRLGGFYLDISGVLSLYGCDPRLEARAREAVMRAVPRALGSAAWAAPRQRASAPALGSVIGGFRPSRRATEELPAPPPPLACELDAVLVQLDVFEDGRVVYAAGTIAFPLGSASKRNEDHTPLLLDMGVVGIGSDPDADTGGNGNGGIVTGRGRASATTSGPLKPASMACGTLRACFGHATIGAPKGTSIEEAPLRNDAPSQRQVDATARLHRVGSARIKWRAIRPRAGPIARANEITTATCVRVDRWRYAAAATCLPRCEDGTRRRRQPASTSCIVGEDAHAHNGLSRGRGGIGADKVPSYGLFVAKGSVESTHKVPTSHYHDTKHILVRELVKGLNI